MLPESKSMLEKWIRIRGKKSKWIRIRPNAVDPGGSGSGSETLRKSILEIILTKSFAVQECLPCTIRWFVKKRKLAIFLHNARIRLLFPNKAPFDFLLYPGLAVPAVLGLVDPEGERG